MIQQFLIYLQYTFELQCMESKYYIKSNLRRSKYRRLQNKQLNNNMYCTVFNIDLSYDLIEGGRNK